MSNRKLLEAEFHDSRERDRARLSHEDFIKKYPNIGAYVVAEKSVAYVSDWIAENCGPGKRVLDYCCGTGSKTGQLLASGADVTGIDISPESILACKERFAEFFDAGRAHFFVMDAEKTGFPDGSFDVIICSGVLHHLDLSSAYAEVSRLLRPDGKVICIEALAHNPILALYRRLTPRLRTAWETDHILRISDIEQSNRYFQKVRVEFFHFFVLLCIPVKKTFLYKYFFRFFSLLDFLFERIPVVNRWCWQAVFILESPVRFK